MTPPASGTALRAIEVEPTPLGTRLRTPAYELLVWTDRPAAMLRSPDGRIWTELSLLASAHVRGAWDEASGIPSATVEVVDDELVRVVLDAPSSIWRRRAVVLDCLPDQLRLRVELAGEGELDDLIVFGATAIGAGGASGEFRSSLLAPVLFTPAPSEPQQAVRSAASAARLGVVGDADPGRLHGIFSPPPLCLAFGRDLAPDATALPEGEWLSVSVVDAVERLGFTHVSYEPLDGGWRLRLAYEGHTRVRGAWTSPDFVLRPATSPVDAIERYRDDLVERGFAGPAPKAAPWHAEPLFCSWGAQCAHAVALALQGLGELRVPEGFVLPPGAEAAPTFSRQDFMDARLQRIGAFGIDPGTVVVDDRWQAAYGTHTVDREKWPDLAGWIRGQHERGRRVLLWFKAWDPEGLDDDACVLDARGERVSADPGSPAYLALLTERVRFMLSPDGLDADGFKTDFTQRAPSGRTLRAGSSDSRADDGVWGVASLHALIRAVHDAAKAVKPDALVVTHTVHPSFGEVTDMVRLNDVLRFDAGGARVPVEDQLGFRAAIARAALPDHLIDTDQWPMPDRAGWLAYARAQGELGVPALYYTDSIDNSNEPVEDADLTEIARLWDRYRRRVGLPERHA